jgi:PAS domain S-box-containing protein
MSNADDKKIPDTGEAVSLMCSEPESSHLLAVLQVLGDGVICIDAQGSVMELNESAAKLFSADRDEVLGRSFFDIHPPSISTRLHHRWTELAVNPSHQLEILESWGDDRWIKIRLIGLTDGAGSFQGVVASYTDETEKKQFEEKQGSLEMKLTQEHKLSAIGILASGIAHNLNGPLSIIIGYLDLLYSRNPHIEEMPIILTQGERMKDIISNMMIKSRHEQDTRKKSINLNSLLQQELKFLEANLEFKHHIDKHYIFAPNLPNINGIYSDFSQCFLNIINNAIDAMYDAQIKSLTVTTEFDDENIYVRFKDTGHGLDPKDAEKLFNPFYSTKPAVGESEGGRPSGTGLGLSSAYQLIKAYGGTVTVDGVPGKGAEFRISIPIERNLAPEVSVESLKEPESETVIG